MDCDLQLQVLQGLDMEQPQAEPMEILLENLEREYYLLKFLVDDNTTSLRREKELSVKAGELIGKLYNELHKAIGEYK